MAALTRIDNPPLVLHLRPAITLSDEDFFAFCRQNPDLRIERSAEGEVEIMALAGGGSSQSQRDRQYAAVEDWSLSDGTGVVIRFVWRLRPAEWCNPLPRCLLGTAITSQWHSPLHRKNASYPSARTS